jgi:hypothetical protein
MNYIYLTTTDTTLLIILAVLMSLFFLLSAIAAGFLIKILQSVKRITDKAEHVVDSVEAAAEVLKDSSEKLTFIKLIKNIIDVSQRKK